MVMSGHQAISLMLVGSECGFHVLLSATGLILVELI